jgi:hypothetical protein
MWLHYLFYYINKNPSVQKFSFSTNWSWTMLLCYAKAKILHCIGYTIKINIGITRKANKYFLRCGFRATRIINEKELGNIFTSGELCKHFFKEDRLIVDRVPYRPELSNASLIVTGRTTCVVSGNNNSRQPFLLTFGSYSKTAIGLVYNLEMYGSFSDADESLKEHVHLHAHNTRSTISLSSLKKCLQSSPELNMLPSSFSFIILVAEDNELVFVWSKIFLSCSCDVL